MSAPLDVRALEPYAALSHGLFLEELAARSRHAVELALLPARAWKWRMRTAALHYARLLARGPAPDLLFASDFVNLAELRALLPADRAEVPALVYFHENQLTYPLREGEARDHHFALVHLYSILSARRALFNSHFHRASFLSALAELLAHVPDVDVGPALETVRARSAVLPLGTALERGAPRAASPEPVLLWNHRWEYDKDPDAFVEAVAELERRGERFRVLVLGQRFRSVPPALERLSSLLGERVEIPDFLADRRAYVRALDRADVCVSTARHEFFGLSTLEALRRGCLPVLPDDLAYPELLPGDPELRARCLYPRADGPVEHLAAALEVAATGRRADERRTLIRDTDRFCWERLAPAFDLAFEEAAAGGDR